MADKDSYEYPEETTTEESYGMGSKLGRTETMSSQFAMLKDPRVIGSIVAFMLLSYLVSHLFAYLIGSRSTEAKPKVTVVKQDNTKVDSIAKQLKNQQQQNQQTLQGYDQKFSSIQNTSKENVMELKQVSSKVNQLEDSLSELSNNISDLHYELSLINDEMKSMKKKPKVVVPKKVAVKKIKKVIKKKKIVLQHYHIRAAIHGRAWLDSKNRSFVTVKLGDRLPTYGKITAIFPDQGLIKTSSGRDISYASTDD